MEELSPVPPFFQVCESDFYVIGLQGGEKLATMMRVGFSIVTISLISSWCNRAKIRRLLLFFSHWMSGLTHQLSDIVMSSMVMLCWSKTEVLGFIKALKFIELASSNMLAVTNLAICVNLALIVSSHHTMSRVQSVSSPKLILCFLAISFAATVAVVPLWETMVVSQTLYWPYSTHPASLDWILIASFFLELSVGACMLGIVTLLLLFRMPEVKECWRLHQRIRMYFGLTLIAIVANLAVGVGGLLFVIWDWHKWGLLISLSWALRHVHIALDTLVLYNTLGVSSSGMDERGGEQPRAKGVGHTASIGHFVRYTNGSARASKWRVLQGRSSSSLYSLPCSPPPTAPPMCDNA